MTDLERAIVDVRIVRDGMADLACKLEGPSHTVAAIRRFVRQCDDVIARMTITKVGK